MANSAMPWVKIWIDFLDDPKMGLLPDPTKLRFIQLVLIAGECDADGALVIVDNSDVMHDKPLTQADVSWRLRVDTEILAEEIQQLSGIGVIAVIDGVITITHFAERQDRKQSEKREKWRKWQSDHRAKIKNVMHDSGMTQANVRGIESVSVIEKKRAKRARKNEVTQTPVPIAITEDITQAITQFDAEIKVKLPTVEPVKKKTKSPDLTMQSPAVIAYREEFHYTPTPEQRTLIAEKVTDLDKWGEILRLWKMNGWNHQNVGFIVDRYVTGGRSKNGHADVDQSIHAPGDRVILPNGQMVVKELK